MKNKEQELKPCECGKTPKLVCGPWGEYQMKCECGKRTNKYPCPDDAYHMWNQRASNAM